MLKKIAVGGFLVTMLISPSIALADTPYMTGLNAIISRCLSPAPGTDPAATEDACTRLIEILVQVVAQLVESKKVNSLPPPTPPSMSLSPGLSVQSQEVTVGTGAQATPGSQVSIIYTGKLVDGTVFDSSAAHANQPLTFVLGSQGIIAGLQIGINGMKEAGERFVAVPPGLGYGGVALKDPSGNVLIPAYSTLIFDVKLVSVKDTDPTFTH